jgi:hypothetical protein
VKKVKAKVFDGVYDVIERLRGSQSRSAFLRHAIGVGLQTMHAQGMKNAPPADGMAPLKNEGEMSYNSRTAAEEMDELVRTIGWWG